MPPPALSSSESTMLPAVVLALSLVLVLPVQGGSPERTQSSVIIKIQSQPPSSSSSVSQDHVGFSVEQDRWPDWIRKNGGSPNTFWLNALDNLKTLSGKPTRIRIGADSEDHTDFNPAVKVHLILRQALFRTSVTGSGRFRQCKTSSRPLRQPCLTQRLPPSTSARASTTSRPCSRQVRRRG
jgi:hypothetical protein